MKRKQIGEKSISIQEAFEQFQRFNQTKNLSPETIRYYDNHSKPFFAFLEDVFQPVDSITKEKIDAYILHLKASFYQARASSSPSPQTRNAHRSDATASLTGARLCVHSIKPLHAE